MLILALPPERLILKSRREHFTNFMPFPYLYQMEGSYYAVSSQFHSNIMPQPFFVSMFTSTASVRQKFVINFSDWMLPLIIDNY